MLRYSDTFGDLGQGIRAIALEVSKHVLVATNFGISL